MEEDNGLPGGMLQRMPFHPPQQTFSHSQQQQQQQRNLLTFAPQPQSHAYTAYSYGGSGGGCGAGKQQQPQSSEEDLVSDAAKRVSQPQSPSPWHRMKWTDSMVRLLVWVVHSVGDEAGAGADGTEPPQHQKAKKAAPLPSPASVQQRKGKWKSVSRAMMEKGFYVSPQQCEDKFNDLNKRYKRVNELLGKGMACRVVDNPSLLDSMDHLPHKSKEEAHKLLSSKHLFFREMCAYHNTCGGSSGLATVTEQDKHAEEAVDSEEEEEEDYENNADSDEDVVDDDGDGERSLSSPLSLSLSSPSASTSAPLQQLRSEMLGLQGEQQQRQWLRKRAAELEEQRVAYQQRALQLERQRFKWLRFSNSKEREMERARLRNQRLRFHNECKLLLLQQKEIRFLDASKSDGNINAEFNSFPSEHHQN